MAAKPYAVRAQLIYNAYGVSPRTRSRLRQRAYNVTPEEVDEILAANGKEDGDRASRKRMANIAAYIDGISEARELYAMERSQSVTSHHFDPTGYSSSDIYFGVQAWVDNPDTDLVWIPLVDGNKWEMYKVAA